MSDRRTSVARKLILVLASSITIVLAAAAFGLSGFLTDKLEQKALEGLQGTNRMVIDMIDTYNRSLQQTVQRLNRVFAANYPQPFTQDAAGLLHHGGAPVTLADTAIPDRFTANAAVAATVLTRKGDDFERTSTSIKDEHGKRASGVPLGASHPAVPALLRGEPYTGKAKMLGRDFMTHYEPIKDRDGKVIGAFFVGLDFTEGLAALKKKVLAVKIGASGYAYAMDMGKDKGVLTIHPASEGKSLLGVKDVNGKPFVDEMLEKKDGIVTYWWQNPNDTAAREKVVAFAHYPDWNWLIASGSYLDEFNAEGKATGRGLLLVTLLLIPVVVALVWWSTRRWIARPLEAAASIAGRVAEGDFTGRIEAAGGDEIGRLMRSLAAMQEHLAQTIREVRNTAASVAADADQLNSAASTVASGSQEQADAASSMAASVEQMSASIDMISQHSGDAQHISSDSERVSLESSETIRAAVEAMNRIADTVRDASQTVETLGREIAEISVIAGVIKEIADQTNLLALNAAIEAARAGEAGRGFAVVADEVRKLAERTSKSTHEIGEMIARIQRGTQEAVANMNRGVGEVSSGVELAAQADEAIRRIRDGARQVTQAVASISDAIREQSVASTTVAKGLETIARMTESNNAEAQNTATAAEELQSLARALHGNVERFRV
ncbi:methyl-accepting chemotaxis protein [Azospira restricta]|uniref:Methyl-accepting chemotaxis protein n=1 Tax=Azospira restricta TaxID=404405 RepID=A0A974PZ04_9RHOO|nr:methyl-accepting chemotaxis protein [Azospira restricta]QRJ63560.1 methyl-accepting chemotaxis protein [Azospira restricta]